MSHEIESLPRFVLVGRTCRASNADPAPIGALWGAFFGGGGAAQIPGRVNDDLYSLYYEYEGDHTQPYTMLLGCRVADDVDVDDLPEGLVATTVPAARYAVHDVSGPQPDTLIQAWQQIWEAPLDRTYSGDFDHHVAPDRVRVHVAIR